MDSKLLGQRIKEARLAKKMTQNEVVGSFITRNMLSQIESGNAVPSMKTLTYLAKVLELPPSVLLLDASDNTADGNGDFPEGAPSMNEASAYSPETHTFCRAKEAYLAGDDTAACELLRTLPTDSLLTDEAAALYARASLRLAQSQVQSECYAEALESAKNAEASASKGIYASLEVKSQALLLLSDAAAKLASQT